MSTQRPSTPVPAEPLAGSGLPRVAVMLLWYPLFTQPFIFRDVEALKRHLPTEVFTMYGLNLRNCSKEMIEAADGAYRLGAKAVLKVLWAFIKRFIREPKLVASVYRKTMGHKWPSLEIMGENLWAFLCGVYLGPVLKERGTDILYAPWPRGTTTAARTVSLLEGIPYVTSARADNLNPADPDLRDKLSDARRIRTNNYADEVRIRALMGDQASTPVDVIYNSLTLPMDDLAPVPMNRPARLLAVGRFDITKGFDILLKACALLRDRGVSFTLTLVGGGGKMMGLGNKDAELKSLCSELKLDGIVSFPGFVTHDRLPGILKDHDVFTAPCVIAPGGQRDGIPNTLIEAMSFGLPVVASRVNALPEIVRHEQTGLLVEPGDEKGLADALERLISSPDAAREYGRSGADLARSLFSPRENGLRLANLMLTAHRS